MLRSYLRLLYVAILLASALPAVVLTCTYLIVLPTRSQVTGQVPSVTAASVEILLALAGGAVFFVVAYALLVRARPSIEATGERQGVHLDTLPARWVGPAIAASATASLFLELTVIRWQGELLPVFAFYKNYSLLLCFVGLGLGYALARRESLPLLLSIPVLVVQIVLLMVVRYGLADWRVSSLWRTPFTEQLNMGVYVASTPMHLVAIYALLAVVFLLTVLGFVPVGQLCGRVMERMPPLKAYGYNLLGSLAGVALLMAVSAAWTPPVIWFGIGFAILLVFQAFDPRPLLFGAMATLIGLGALAWPVTPGLERIHSPYQLIERGVGEHGLALIRAAGHYYQRVHDLALSNTKRDTDERLRRSAQYYEFAYHLRDRPPARVAVVGSGMGNDVAAALRAGAAEIDAIEIDPVILRLGEIYHPEQPYRDKRVRAIVNDARTFLRTTPRSYDLVAYALLDSHTLLSHAASVRLDSFVYTVEAFREARQRLTENGIISVSFSVMTGPMAHKIYLMLTQAFDGRPPLCVYSGYDGSVIFLQSRDGTLILPPERLRSSGMEDVTQQYASATVPTDVSTDDWPFFYMPRRVYPVTYLGMIGLILVLSLVLVRSFLVITPSHGGLVFFFLGAGFMLVETKATTELGLSFGNTWQVVGIAVSGVLAMAFLANAAVSRLQIKRPAIAFVLLLGSLLAGYAISAHGGLGPSPVGKLGTVVVITLPILFSGIVFSALLARFGNIAQAMSMNLLGAMVGGLLEYNAMYFGYRSLYLLALVLYAAAALGHRFVR